MTTFPQFGRLLTELREFVHRVRTPPTPPHSGRRLSRGSRSRGGAGAGRSFGGEGHAVVHETIDLEGCKGVSGGVGGGRGC